jgi:hypothetical protein
MGSAYVIWAGCYSALRFRLPSPYSFQVTAVRTARAECSIMLS